MKKRHYHPQAFRTINFDNLVNDFFNTAFPTETSLAVPPTNVVEKEEGYALELSLPGFSKEDLKINVEKDLLTISAEVEKTDGEEKTNYKRKEFSKRSFKRSFHLADTIDVDSIKASFENGILTVSLAKKEEALPVKKVVEIA